MRVLAESTSPSRRIGGLEFGVLSRALRLQPSRRIGGF